MILKVFDEIDVGGVAASSCAHSSIGISVVNCCVDYRTLINTGLRGRVSETARTDRYTSYSDVVSICIVWTASWNNTC